MKIYLFFPPNIAILVLDPLEHIWSLETWTVYILFNVLFLELSRTDSQLYCEQFSVLIPCCCCLFFISYIQYKAEEPVKLWVNKVGPYNNPQETYNYYSLPFCQPSENPAHKWGGLGEVLGGNELIDSQIDIKFLSMFTLHYFHSPFIYFFTFNWLMHRCIFFSINIWTIFCFRKCGQGPDLHYWTWFFKSSAIYRCYWKLILVWAFHRYVNFCLIWFYWTWFSYFGLFLTFFVFIYLLFCLMLSHPRWSSIVGYVFLIRNAISVVLSCLYYFGNRLAFFEQASLARLTKIMKTSTTCTLTRTLLLNIMVTGYVLHVTLIKHYKWDLYYMFADRISFLDNPCQSHTRVT